MAPKLELRAPRGGSDHPSRTLPSPVHCHTLGRSNLKLPSFNLAQDRQLAGSLKLPKLKLVGPQMIRVMAYTAWRGRRPRERSMDCVRSRDPSPAGAAAARPTQNQVEPEPARRTVARQALCRGGDSLWPSCQGVKWEQAGPAPRTLQGANRQGPSRSRRAAILRRQILRRSRRQRWGGGRGVRARA